jgi:hypothetical protein
MEDMIMAVFDQRNQKVQYQYNAAGNINFASVQSNEDLLSELKKLRVEFDTAIEARVFEKKTAIDATYQLDKALIEAEEPKPNKTTIEEHLKEAKALIEGVAAATGLVTALAQAAELARRLL